jgi:TatA/E family protein of Tat protein translocase
MGGLSIWHLLIIAFILMMVFGPNRIGDMGGSLGKAIRNFKKGIEGTDDIDVTHTTRNEQLKPGEPSASHTTTAGAETTSTGTESNKKS